MCSFYDLAWGELMRIQNIASRDWPDFFTAFSREHQGLPVSVEIFGEDIGAQLQNKNLAFEGIVDECNSNQRHQVIIMAGKGPADHITHTITRPLAVSVEHSDDGRRTVLAIMSADGLIALLRFHKRNSLQLAETAHLIFAPHRGRPC
jgi:hypothetical protein